MKIKLLSTALALVLFCASCKKTNDDVTSIDETTINNLKVSNTFDWSTTNEVNFSIGISDARFQSRLHTVYIYDANPANGGKILAKGSVSLIAPFNTKVSFSKATKSVYLVKSAPDGTKIGQEVLLTSKNINLGFSSTAAIQTAATVNTGKVNGKLAVTAESTNIVPSCERQVANVNNIDMAKKEVVCYTTTSDRTISINNANFGGTIVFNAPNRKITIQNFNHTNVSIVIQANTTVVFGGIEIKTGEIWSNYGTLEFTGKADIKGTINNNSTAKFTNLQINSSGTVNNYCKLTADEMTADNILNNYNYVSIKNGTRVNSNGKVNMIGGNTSGAYFETKDLLKGTNKVNFFGTNATSLVKTQTIDNNLLLDAKQSNNSQIVAGTISLCTPVQNIPANFFIAPAVASCDAYIETSECMPTSNGTPPVVIKDKDGDGVNDGDDDFPDDGTKAYKNYSVNYNAGGSTLAFEDNWPTKGDYDLNDVVITYRYLVVTNADNRVVEINAGYKLIATGADFLNGAGIEFPLAAGKAKLTKAPTGVYLEGGQDNVVLILFENARKIQATGNTILGKTVSPTVDFDITLQITDGPEMKDFGAVVYNPFIWNGTNGGRSIETHLFGKTPTKLADLNLFETRDDFSKSNNKYYSTKERLPWVIEVPVANFAYPIEGARIDLVYKNFTSWATSSGNSSQEWYSILAGGVTPGLTYPVK